MSKTKRPVDRDGVGDTLKHAASRRGRKRDPTRDEVILDATLAVLAEQGYDGMTIDMVAAHTGSARATVYRRRASKADLVLEAVARLSREDVHRGEYPPPASLDTLAEVIPMMCVARAVQQQPITRTFGLALIDNAIIPALRGAP